MTMTPFIDKQLQKLERSNLSDDDMYSNLLSLLRSMYDEVEFLRDKVDELESRAVPTHD